MAGCTSRLISGIVYIYIELPGWGGNNVGPTKERGLKVSNESRHCVKARTFCSGC